MIFDLGWACGGVSVIGIAVNRRLDQWVSTEEVDLKSVQFPQKNRGATLRTAPDTAPTSRSSTPERDTNVGPLVRSCYDNV